MYKEKEGKEIEIPKGFIETDVLDQVESEYQAWKRAIIDKRTKMKDDLELYYVAATKKDKVNVHSIYTTMQTLMSVYYNDRAVVEFEGRTSAGQAYAENINRLYEFDYDEMDMDVLDYQWNFDRFFHWVGIKALDGWNVNTATPIAKVVSPLSWIPDPLGGFTMDSHRWAGFEIEATKTSLWKGFVNVDLINDKPAKEQQEIRDAYTSWRDLNSWQSDVEENIKVSLYNHYTRIDNQPYLITTANHNTLIVRMMKIKAITKEEKADKSLIDFPISLKYYSPLKGDPFGVSVPDLLRDKQGAKSKLFNLTLISATRNALWDDKLYNPKKIKNIKDLQTPTIGGKYIAANVNEGETLSNALMTVQKENPTSLPVNVDDWLDGLIQLSTGINANTMWVGGMQNMTAAESQSIQKNANLRFILWTRIGLWWEKDFAKKWKRSYINNLSGTKKKVFAITNVFGSSYFELGRADFITEEDLKINVRSKSEIDEEKNKYKNDLYGIVPQALADPETPTVGKLILKRKLYDFGLFSPEEIAKLTLNVDEQNAMLDVELINENEAPLDPQEGQDHLVYLSIYYWADESSTKWEAIQNRKAFYLESTQRKAQEAAALQQQAWMGGDNTQANIASSNAASRQWAAINNEATQVASNI